MFWKKTSFPLTKVKMHTLEGEGRALTYSLIFIQYSKGVCPTEILGVAVVEMMLLNLEHSLTRENGARDG